MANGNPVNELANLFGGSTPVGLSDEIASVAGILRQLQSREEAVAMPSSTDTGGGWESTLGSVLGGVGSAFGLGLSPLISGLAGLFGGGGDANATAPLVPYIAPPSVSVNAGISGSASGVFATDTADGGVARGVPSTNITVSVQAMDSQSFLDRSNDIALAVRQAMLESTTLNDVIREVSS